MLCSKYKNTVLKGRAPDLGAKPRKQLKLDWEEASVALPGGKRSTEGTQSRTGGVRCSTNTQSREFLGEAV